MSVKQHHHAAAATPNNNTATGAFAQTQPGSSGQRAGSTRSISFVSAVMAPAKQWYKEMRWSRNHVKLTHIQRLELIASYAPDWILTLLTAGLLQIINNVYGFRREFSLTDTGLQHTYAQHERISVGFLAVLAFIIPLAFMALISLGISRSVWDFHAGLLGLVVAHAFTLTATTVIKVCVGRPRPDLIDRCKPRDGAQNASPFGLVTEAICTTDVTSHLIQDGFRSFPSGHSSTAFAGLTFFTLFLAGKFHVWQRSRGNAFSAWILFFPMIGATLIAVSRTMDYRHHATDVIAGAILGFVIALSAYHNYYPPLWHAQSHKPWAPRTNAAMQELHQSHQHTETNSDGVLNGQTHLYSNDVDDEEDVERTPLHYGDGQGAGGGRHHRTFSNESQDQGHTSHFATPNNNANNNNHVSTESATYVHQAPSNDLEMARSAGSQR